MQYFKKVYGEYVLAYGIGNDGLLISREEYTKINDATRTRPTAPSGYIYKLRADTLEWELVELPPEPDPGEEDATAEDYEQALADLGVKL